MEATLGQTLVALLFALGVLGAYKGGVEVGKERMRRSILLHPSVRGGRSKEMSRVA